MPAKKNVCLQNYCSNETHFICIYGLYIYMYYMSCRWNDKQKLKDIQEGKKSKNAATYAKPPLLFWPRELSTNLNGNFQRSLKRKMQQLTLLQKFVANHKMGCEFLLLLLLLFSEIYIFLVCSKYDLFLRYFLPDFFLSWDFFLVPS